MQSHDLDFKKNTQSQEMKFKNRMLDFEKERMEAIERMNYQKMGLCQLALAVLV